VKSVLDLLDSEGIYKVELEKLAYLVIL